MIILKKLKKLLCTAFAVAAGVLSTPATSKATLAAGESDLFLCFRATGGQGANTDYLVNIGPASPFLTAGGSISVDTGGAGHLLTDLNTIYGNDWKTRADVFWSVSGVQKAAGNGFPTNTMFASRAQETAGTPSTPWTRPTAFSAGAPALKMVAMREPGFTAGTTDNGSQTQSGDKALIQSTNAINSYASYMPGGVNTTGSTAFGYFAGATTIEGNFGAGTAGAILDIYQLIPAAGNLPALRFGSFQLNDNAELTFTSGFTTQAQFASANASVNEDAGSVTLTVNRGGDTSAAFTLNLSTTSGTAVDGTDFTGQTNTPVAFATGDASKTVNVAILNRPGFQGNRTFSATITVASGAVQVIAPSTISINIVETAPEPPVLSLSAATFSVAENVASGNATVTVNRSGPTNIATSVSLSTTDGTAVAGTDYTAQTNTAVNFAIGEATKNVDIPVAVRAGFQGDRAFTVTISNPTNGATLGTLATATVTIQDSEPNPAGTIAFSASTYETNASAPFNVTLNRTLGTTGAVEATVAVVGVGTLTIGEDFTINPTTVAFADGQATATVAIQFTAGAGPLPGNINLQITGATNGASVGTPSTTTVNVTSSQVTLVSGTYMGLIVPTGETPPAGNLHNASGLLSVKILSNGNFTGKVLIGGATLPFTGKFNPDGTATFKPGTSATRLLATKGKTPVTFGDLTLRFDGENVSATIGEIAVVIAHHAAFSASAPVDSRFLVNKGKYTGILPSKEQDVLGAADFPQGTGVGNISVSKTGKFTFKGKLADGTPLTMSGSLASDYTVPLYAALYAKKGSIGGVVKLDDTPTESDLSGTDFLWLRPAQTKAPVYLAGWPTGVKIDLLGATYAASKTASALPNLGAENPTTGNADLQFAAGLLTSDQNFAVNVSVKNKVTNVLPPDKTYKVTIAAPTGAVTGFFLHTDTKKTAFKGIIYQAGPDAGAFGYFLSTPVKNGPAGESGSVVLVAQ